MSLQHDTKQEQKTTTARHLLQKLNNGGRERIRRSSIKIATKNIKIKRKKKNKQRK